MQFIKQFIYPLENSLDAILHKPTYLIKAATRHETSSRIISNQHKDEILYNSYPKFEVKPIKAH